ncbi:hypothetical protein NDU88_003764 [Pleurodeles waltl]|uniref:Uncharacterized protein n=1 Tax=Pleurodeles waltl TaxID=8319 RepID=A0AAV7NKR3_PLEWA|nr:hypothetical protein NDU88_003764 [Pleurodeles waltl]
MGRPGRRCPSSTPGAPVLSAFLNRMQFRHGPTRLNIRVTRSLVKVSPTYQGWKRQERRKRQRRQQRSEGPQAYP